MPISGTLVPAEEKQHRFFPLKVHPRAVANIDSISSRRGSAVHRARFEKLLASTSIRGSSESPGRNMASPDERSRVQLSLPLQPAIGPSGRDRERFDPPVSARCRERRALGVGHRLHLRAPGSAGSTTVVTYAVFALLRRSRFPPRPRQRNSEGVAARFPLPCF